MRTTNLHKRLDAIAARLEATQDARQRPRGRMFERLPGDLWRDVMNGQTLTGADLDELGGRQNLLVMYYEKVD